MRKSLSRNLLLNGGGLIGHPERKGRYTVAAQALIADNAPVPGVGATGCR